MLPALCLTCPKYVIMYVLYIVLSIFLENVFPFTPPFLSFTLSLSSFLRHSLPTEALQPGHHNAVLRCLHLVRLLHEPSQSQGEDEHAVREGEEGGREREGK